MTAAVDRAAPWQTRAACAGHNPDMWTTPEGPHGLMRQLHTQRAREGLAICAHCPVSKQCGADAVRGGIWGRAGVIRAGIAYNEAGRALPTCEECGRNSLSRSRYCESHGTHSVHRHRRTYKPTLVEILRGPA